MTKCPDCVFCPDCGTVAYCLSERGTIPCAHGSGVCWDCWPGVCIDCGMDAAEQAGA